jgi:hypothetical protein
MKNIFQSTAWILLPACVYLVQTWVLRGWIVDDAGISFAYARNFAQGNGLTAWPGTQPVEGFSNFLWTLLLALFHLIHVFDPIVTPKIVAAIFIMGSFHQLHRVSLQLTGSPWVGLGINMLLAINAPFIIWTQSGLENALYIFLLVLLLRQMLHYTVHQHRGTAIYISYICFLLAITRPEGCIYFFLFPAVQLLTQKKHPQKQIALVYHTLFFMLGFGAFLVFRLFYFHNLIPNTFYAKFNWVGAEGKWLEKLEYLSFAVGGRWGKYLVAAHLLAYIHLFFIHKPKRALLGVLFIFWGFGWINFFILPNDWMGELRFALPFMIFFYTGLFFLCYLYLQHYAFKSDAKKIVFLSLLLGFMGYTGYHFHLRLLAFSRNPTVPFTEIKTTYIDKFNAYNQQLHLQHASLLLPDVGAALYYSELKIYDAAGLCDPSIAKNLGKNPGVLRNYVFDEIKPTFIHLHGKWAGLYRLEQDIRFGRDYIPLPTITPQERPEDFIRKDAINTENRNLLEGL